jgi:hypothetical protein
VIVGGKLALIRGKMPERKTLDGCPGACPEIRADGDSVVFRLTIASGGENFRLTVRCDSEGGVWASIADDCQSTGTNSQS